MFKRFQSSWADMDHAAFRTGLEDIEVTRLGERPEVLNFVEHLRPTEPGKLFHLCNLQNIRWQM